MFDPSMRDVAVNRWQLEGDLRRALERNEFRLHYQPIVSLRTGRVAELEALARWQHPDRGMVSPADFIPLAEETGLIVPLGRWTVREACAQLRRWEARLPAAADLAVGVNLSGRQPVDGDVVADVAAALRDADLAPNRLHLEITETSIIEQGSAATTKLGQLKNLQVQLYLDDFGTGYSSLSYLHRLPVDTLKVDRSFVAGLGTDPMSTSIVQAVVSLAHSLKLRVIAEGVETEAQRSHLRDMGCDLAQGHLFSKPVPAEDVVGLLQDIGGRARAKSA